MDCRVIKMDRPWPPNQVRARRFVVYDVFDPPDIPFERHVIRVAGLVERLWRYPSENSPIATAAWTSSPPSTA
jgi:hypothetical protein